MRDREDDLSVMVHRHYSEYPYPPIGSRFDDTARCRIGWELDYEFLNYLFTGSYRSQSSVKILDAGCGTGYLTAYLARANPDARIWAVDFSRNSLERARERLQQAGLPADRVRLVEADLLDLDLEEKFDLIVCAGVLHHLSSPERGLGRLKAHLAPNGFMYLWVYNRYFRFWIRWLRQLTGRLRENNADFAEGIAIVKELVRSIPQFNVIRKLYEENLQISADIFGAGYVQREEMFVDDYLSPNELHFTTQELFALLDNVGLHFLRFRDEELREVDALFKESPLLQEKARRLSRRERYAISQIVYDRVNFAFFASADLVERKRLGHDQILACRVMLSPLIEERTQDGVLNLVSPLGTGVTVRSEEARLFYHSLRGRPMVTDIIREYAARYEIPLEAGQKRTLEYLTMMESEHLLFLQHPSEGGGGFLRDLGRKDAFDQGSCR